MNNTHHSLKSIIELSKLKKQEPLSTSSQNDSFISTESTGKKLPPMLPRIVGNDRDTSHQLSSGIVRIGRKPRLAKVDYAEDSNPYEAKTIPTPYRSAQDFTSEIDKELAELKKERAAEEKRFNDAIEGRSRRTGDSKAKKERLLREVEQEFQLDFNSLDHEHTWSIEKNPWKQIHVVHKLRNDDFVLKTNEISDKINESENKLSMLLLTKERRN